MAKYSLEPVDVPPVQTDNRIIKTQLPVPESLKIYEKLQKTEPRSMQGQPPIIWERAEGIHVYDPYGNKWIDWSSGVLITNAGHSHPKIVEAVKKQIDKRLLSTYVFVHEQRAELTGLLADMAPDGLDKVFLLSTGSEATENCIKLARTYGVDNYGKNKHVIVSFTNAFHGRTLGAQLAGGMQKQKEWIVKTDCGFIQVPFPDGFKNEDTGFDLFEKTLEGAGVNPDDVAGVISETYQGVGPDFMPVEYAQALRKWCDKHNVVLIMDEVQAGFGRCGTFFGFETYGIVPDLIACGKGISSSLPISAVIGKDEIMELYAPGSMTSTHSGSPLPVAAAIANIKAIIEEKLVENAAQLGPILEKGLLKIQTQFSKVIGCVHAKGLVAGMQIVKPGTKTPDSETAQKINEKCFHKGLLMFAPVGIGGECIKIAPPLCINRQALEEGLSVLSEACSEVLD